MILPVPSSTRTLIARRVAVISAVFLLLVTLIMGANLYLIATVDPLDSPALNALMTQLEQDPGNDALRQQVRELDLLARRAFFIRQWQLETGVFLLVAAAIVLILSLHLMGSGERRLPDLKQCPGLDDPWSAAVRARHVIAVAGVLVLLLGALGALLIGRDIRVPVFDDRKVGQVVATSDAVVDEHQPDLSAAWRATVERHWPSFRGPGGLGVAIGADPPIAWDGVSGEGILWKSEVPRSGFSSPVVWGNRVFLTGADRDKREVYCYDADTGALLWTADTEGVPGAPAELPEVIEDTGYAAPSVATDGQRIVALFGTGVILGLDFEGRRLWARSLPVPDNHYGHSSSLIVYGETVYLQYDHFGGSRLMALDMETGRPRWEVMREADISWASPILVDLDGSMILVLNAAPMVAAYDALTGEELWSSDVMSGEIGASPAYAAGRVFAANQYAQAVALNVRDGVEQWGTTRVEMPDAASPVATGRYLFLPTSYGTFSCLDATDGTLVWQHEFDRGGYGSPILVDDRLYWVTADGVTHVFKAAGEFERIAEPALGEPSVCTPAAVGQRLYIRGKTNLYCIGTE